MKKAYSMILVATLSFAFFFIQPILIPQKQVLAETYEWRLQSVWGGASVTHGGLKLFSENVKKATDGKINIKIYEANQLVKTKATLKAVQSGAIEMGCSTGAYIARVIPEAIFEGGLVFSFTTWEELHEALTKYGIEELLQEAYKEKGLHHITVNPGGLFALMSNKPVRTVGDLTGLKIRTLGMMPRVLQQFGAAPVSIPGAEQYMALQRGTVDATVYTLESLEAYKLKEVVKYVVVLPSGGATNIFMNLKIWESLPSELQKSITKVSTQHQEYIEKGYLDKGDAAIDSYVKGNYGELLKFSELDIQKLREVAVEEWDKYGAKSPRCKKVVDQTKKYMVDKKMIK